MTPQKAEELALSVLGWLAASDDMMGVFLGSSGSSIDSVRAQASDPAFLGSVLDFLLMDDSWVTAFCDANSVDYRQPMIARQYLPGGDVPNWT
ncbi:DUF3572 domain-containing protein [Litoreibacter albidus]|uniref:DUF3572 domain-containing protein n=1 Tax=Litoreibacter albidus TaxID=670155 RepID=A0A1H2R8H6_9RHOB|nr:DUF3572 domain-containing protein [Litoreibacter albidus]SDW15498.1 Protein of unknown function [Litoreibacter albidus]